MAESKVKKLIVEEETTSSQGDGLSRLARSALRAGINLALMPIALLPDSSQKHMRRAGNEFALGLAELLRSAAESLDNMAREI